VRIRTDIPDADVIPEDDDDVGFLVRRLCRDREPLLRRFEATGIGPSPAPGTHVYQQMRAAPFADTAEQFTGISRAPAPLAPFGYNSSSWALPAIPVLAPA